tara:strand:- start:5811 stop:6332 length:522 start_codon:yes stop_codon:yes gene_type:complete
MATTTKKEPSVQEVRNIGLEDRLDKVILLIEAQNKAWQRCLTLLTEMNTLLFEKYKSQDILLEEHPSIKAPPPATVGGAPQPQPFNNYSDSLPYGTELEAEREAPPESFPAGQGAPPATYNDEPESAPAPAPAPAAAPENSVEGVHHEPEMRIAPGPPVSSKAELLERVEKVS